MRAFTLAVLAAGAAAEAAQYAHFTEPVFIPAMAPRDNNCPELPKLCTGEAMLYGYGTTLTYLCPEKTQGPSTVHTTVTVTTTVTAAPTDGAPGVPVPPKDSPASEEPTTTTTVKSTLTQYKTVTIINKANGDSRPSLTPPHITAEFSAALPSLIPPQITWEFSAVPPNKAGGDSQPSLTPPHITAEFSAALPSLTPPHVTWEFSAVPPVPNKADGGSQPALTPPHITWEFSAALPSVASLTPPVITDEFPAISQAPPAQDAIPTLSAGKGTTINVSYSEPMVNSSTVAPTPIYPNATSHSGYDAPSLKLARAAKASETTTLTTKGMAGQTGVSFVALFLGLMVAAFIV